MMKYVTLNFNLIFFYYYTFVMRSFHASSVSVWRPERLVRNRECIAAFLQLSSLQPTEEAIHSLQSPPKTMSKNDIHVIFFCSFVRSSVIKRVFFSLAGYMYVVTWKPEEDAVSLK